MNLFVKQNRTFIFTLLLSFFAGNLHADDTEIYFNANIRSNVENQPNLLFILDTSGSMGWDITGTNDVRMQVLKDAMNNILTDLDNVNVGIMRYNYYYGGPVLFPITDLRTPASAVAGEPDDNTTRSFTYTITDNDNDAYEYITDNNGDGILNNVVLTDTNGYGVNTPGQTITTTSCTAGATQTVTGQYIDTSERDARERFDSINLSQKDIFFDTSGDRHEAMRFGDIDVPPNATIESAYLRMQTRSNKNGTGRAYVHAVTQDTVANGFFNTCSGCAEFSSAGVTSNRVQWSVSQTKKKKNVTSPDIKNIISEITSRGCTGTAGTNDTTGCTWNTGGTNGDITLMLKDFSGSQKNFYNLNSNGTQNSRQPRLEINWSREEPVTTCTTGTTVIPGNNLLTALRFEGIAIPQGATITSAKLLLSSAKDNQNTAMDLKIRGELVDSADGFLSNDSHLSGRFANKTTNDVTWSLGTSNADEWGQDEVVESPDISTVVQEVVGQTNWCGGNDLALFISGTANTISGTGLGGNGVREFNLSEVNGQPNDPGSAPQLKITYQLNSSTGSACNLLTDVDSVSSKYDDVEETVSTGSNSRTSGKLNFKTNTDVGVRFTNVELPPNVNITEASVLFTSSNVDTGTASIKIYAEDTASADSYDGTNNDLIGNGTSSGREYHSTTVTWSPEDWDVANSTYETADISSLIQEVVNRSGWVKNNSLALRFETISGNRDAFSYDGGAAPILNVTYEGNDNSDIKTVREKLIEVVNDLPTRGSTPIVSTLYEAAQYWTGGDIDYGDTRSRPDYAERISHPGSYCTEDPTTSAIDCGDANTTASGTDAFGQYYPSGCSAANLNDSDCEGMAIRHKSGTTTKYVSPFKSESQCAANYQIMLTDGAATINGAQSRIRADYLANASCQGSFTDSEGNQSIDSNQQCGLDLVEHLASNDLSDSIDDTQSVTTYTVGFDIAGDNYSTRWLKEMADIGGGEFKAANSASELVEAFTQIIDDVRDDPTSFASPALSTNAFNTLFTRDEVYFGLFSPDTLSAWSGNVKKFTVCTSDVDEDPNAPANCDFIGRVLDSNGNKAIDTDNRFDADALSFWTDASKLPDDLEGNGDGVQTLQGGAGQQLDDYTERTIYTETTSTGVEPTLGTSLNDAAYKLNSTTWNSGAMSDVRNLVCTTPGDLTANSSCANVMQWMTGKVINDEVSDVDDDTRWTVHDVLHSSPTVVTYGGVDTNSDGDVDEFFDKLLFASNGGALHFVNASNDSAAGGKEEWAFYPMEVLDEQEAIFDNTEGDHVYTMDLSPVIRQCDGDSDGSIEPGSNDGCDADQDGTGGGDFVHVFAGMRRGGKNYYALDISGTSTVTSDDDNSIEPKFLWRIEGGVAGTDFQDLAQTWSKPILTTISILDSNDAPKDMEVLIFGGGYDESNDVGFGANGAVSPSNNTDDNSGNIVYIVNPYTGELIFSVGGSGTNADIKVPDMHHSIPSEIATLDSDSDGDTDRLYFGDTGGQVWRIDLAADVKPSASSPEGSTVVGQLASISSTGNGSINQRRFFEKPSVVQVIDSQFSSVSEYDYIAFGTGNRANPLDTTTEDYFFAFRDYQITEMQANSGANLAINYPTKNSGTGPITVSDMVDASNSLLEDLDGNTVSSSAGWYINFSDITADASERDGEKILSAATTLFGVTFFTSYSPNKVVEATASNVNSQNLCVAQIGGGSLYALNLLSTSGYFTDSVSGREHGTTLGGIASAVIPIFTKDGVYGLVGTEGGALQFDEDGNATELQLGEQNSDRTYWYEY